MWDALDVLDAAAARKTAAQAPAAPTASPPEKRKPKNRDRIGGPRTRFSRPA